MKNLVAFFGYPSPWRSHCSPGAMAVRHTMHLPIPTCFAEDRHLSCRVRNTDQLGENTNNPDDFRILYDTGCRHYIIDLKVLVTVLHDAVKKYLHIRSSNDYYASVQITNMQCSNEKKVMMQMQKKYRIQ
jgi:hypothetical protein